MSSQLRVLSRTRLDEDNPPGHSTRPVAPIVKETVTIDSIEPKFVQRSEPWIELCNSLAPGKAQKVRAYPQDAAIIVKRLVRKRLVQGEFKIVERASSDGYWKLKTSQGRTYRGDTWVVKLPSDPLEKTRVLGLLKHGQHRLDGEDYRGIDNTRKLKESLYKRWLEEFQAIPPGKEKLVKVNRATLQTRVRKLVSMQRIGKDDFRIRRGPSPQSAYVGRSR